MSDATLITHCGAHVVPREELLAVKAPPATSTWFPLSHGSVLTKVEDQIARSGFRIERSQYALTRNDARFFGTLDLASELAVGVKLAVGIRNSFDKSLPIGFCAGSRVVVCDNLCFAGEITVARKHTRFGETRFIEALSRAVGGLSQFRQAEAARVKRFSETEVTDTTAESLMLRAFDQGIVSHRLLPGVIKEWREPSFEDFKPRTLWSVFNAFTTVLGGRQKSNPQQFAHLSIRLSGLIGEFAGVRDDEKFQLTA